MPVLSNKIKNYNFDLGNEQNAVELEQGKYRVCYNYALKDNSFYSCNTAYKKILEDYFPIKLKDIKRGDMVVYLERAWYDKKYHPVHFAIVECIEPEYSKICLEAVTVLSKWGRTPIYEHNLQDVPDIYGDSVQFFRKK